MEINSAQNLILPLDAFVRSVGVNSRSPHAFFLGAGASITSGVPSATICIWEWKRRIFLTKNPGLEVQFRDITLTSVQERVQRWLDAEGCYPPLDSQDEYSIYAELCYPIPEDRRRYFQSLAERATPYIGYHLLCLLAEADIVKSLWTTNFDSLIPKATASSTITAIEAGLDTTKRVDRSSTTGELLCIALHGDYRYDKLKNTSIELQKQDDQLRKDLGTRLKDSSLIVSGYSGRDQSVMSALTDSYSQPGTGRLYWCGRESSEPDSVVTKLLLTARAHGRDAYYVPTSGFDDLLVRLSLHCLADDLLERARKIHFNALAQSNELSPPFSIETYPIVGIIKSNAFLVECPSEVLEFKSQCFMVEGAWELLRKQISGRNVAAALFKNKVLAFGNITDVREAFAGKIDGAIERTPINEKELSYTDGILVSLLTEAITRSIASTRGLGTDGKRLVWSSQPLRAVRVYQTDCFVYEAALLFLRRYAGKQYLVIKPTVRGTSKNHEDISPEINKELKRMFLTKQYNSQFNDAVNKWRERLFPNGNTTLEFPPNTGSIFRFNVSPTPAFASISSPKARNSINLPPKIQRHIVYSGVQYLEPPLLFSNAQADGFIKDVHPIRGIVINQPYDYALTRSGFNEEVRIGVVCSAQDTSKVSDYLNSLQHRKLPDSKEEYLLEYPGFAQAFGLPLSIPQPQNNAWIQCPDLNPTLDTKQGATQLSRYIINCIKALKAAASPNVILVYIPARWRTWEHYEEDGIRHDLHDFTKAYCVQNGIATQFLREETLRKPYQCEILWWLALSLYTKSMRTPWVLEGIDNETAFIGFGYSLNTNLPRGRHVVMGCSHIYNSMGMGLKYTLSKIEEPIWRQRNPFLSREDARRFGDMVRQLFYESMMNLPKRVVIHKLTPFLPSERDGLLEGLSGIPIVDMIEVNKDRALRYVASRISRNEFRGDGFPVRRGTTVVLDKRRALIWVHGTTEAINPGRNYYLGKSRIPAPLLMIRHHGTSNLSLLARELLGLSKMNWNSFDMYTKLPATIQSSNEIARIGALLERFRSVSYDYRLFI